MLDLLLLGTEEVSDSEMPKAFTELAEVRINPLTHQRQQNFFVSKFSKIWKCFK